MYKIGTDIVKISRIEKSIKSQSFLNKVFTENERAYCKKAYFKALGTGLKFPLTDVEIGHDENGKPHLCGVDSSDISISHDGEYAVATVILW